MKIKFQADADLNAKIVHALLRREPNIDFQLADAAGIREMTDPDVLEYSAHAGRVLVSHDYHTMPAHFANYISMHQSPGVFLLAQDLPIRFAVEEILTIWETSEAEEWVNRLQYLPL